VDKKILLPTKTWDLRFFNFYIGFLMDEMKEKVEKFRKEIRVRNLLEYFAAIFVVVCFGYFFLRTENVWAKIFIVEIILAALGICIFLFLKASNLPELKGEPLRDYQRRQIKKQIEILSIVHLWYLLPLFIGVIGFYFSDEAINKWGVIGFIPFVTVFGLVWWFNIWSVEKLRKELEEL
jgi:hypothetical protein